MKLRIIASALLFAAAFTGAKAQSSIQNPMTQAVLAVYAEELAADPSNYGIYLARADEYYRHSEYIKALDDVTKVLQLAPEKDEDVRLRSYILRAGIYNETHRPQEALNDLNEAIKIAPDSYSVVYQKANTDYTLGNLADAKTGFIKLERLNARTAEPYIGQARIAVKENNLGLANELLEKAVGVDPSNAEIYVRRASVRKQMGDHNGAVCDFILALSCDSKNERAINALLEYGSTNYPATMAGLTNAISTAPEVGMYRYIRAVVAQAHFHYLAAINDYQEILDKKIYNYYGIYASIAECNYCLGNYTEALDNADRALSMITDNASYYVVKSRILRALGRNDDAIKVAAQALAVDRQSNEALTEMALAYVGTGNYEEASNLLGEAMLNDAENATYPMLRAWIYEKYLNKEKNARALYEQVSQMENFYLDNPRSLKGFALLFLGDKEAGDRWMNNILRTVVDFDGLIHYYAACYYSQTGMTERALRCMETSLEKGYANYHNWTKASEANINCAPLRSNPEFTRLLDKYSHLFK